MTAINSKTLGSIYIQSGYGVPTHIAPTGSLYTNIPSGSLYINQGGAEWAYIPKVCYGLIFSGRNTVPYTYPANLWVSSDTAGIVFNTFLTNGCYRIGGRLYIDNGRSGYYNIKAGVLIGPGPGGPTGSSIIGDYNFGVGIDGIAPLPIHWRSGQHHTGAGGSGNTVFPFSFIPVDFNIRLESGQYINTYIRANTLNQLLTWRDTYLFIKRIGD